MRRWQWALRLVTRRMWFRAALFCVFAVALALASALAGHMISYSFAAKVGSKSVDGILNLLASSMLAVTTFALTAMVQAYSGATNSITPRAVQLLIDDSTSQNALATFLGFAPTQASSASTAIAMARAARIRACLRRRAVTPELPRDLEQHIPDVGGK